MLQIRLSKGGSAADGGGSTAKSSLPVETVTVACPDHLVLADLPVAKSLGAITASSGSSVVKSVGRRSRRHLGERVHFCVCCDHPIAIYGRLIPCEHAFCFTCARSDSSCYLCDERIQKIQTIKMMEGIFICAAPHCLKSFLKRSEFESHIHESHADLLQLNPEKDGGSEADGIGIGIPRPPSADLLFREASSRGVPRSGFSPNSASQPLERDDKGRRNPSREQTPLKPPPPLQPKQLSFNQQHQSPDFQADGNPAVHGLERPFSWFHHPPGFDNQSGPLLRQDSDQNSGLPSYPVPVIVNQPPLFSYPPFPAEGAHRYIGAPYEMPRPEMAAEGGGQASLLGFPPAAAAAAAMAGFPENFRAWSAVDSQGRVSFFPGEFGRFPDGGGTAMNPPPLKEAEMPASMPSSSSIPPPPQFKWAKLSGDGGQDGHGYAWQGEKRPFGGGPE